MESKIRIKIGAIEVEYEGSEAFLKTELPAFIKSISELQISPVRESDPEQNGSNNKPESVKNVIQLSTKSIAAKLNVKSGRDLVVAAAAHLCFVKEKAKFTRKELLDEMKTATSYYKATYSNNLSMILSRLIKTQLNEPSTDVYALTADTENDLRKKLA